MEINIPKKITIIFKNFENKEIKIYLAGKIQKGVYNYNIYSFSFKDSKSIIET